MSVANWGGGHAGASSLGDTIWAETVLLAADGLTNLAIADRLGITRLIRTRRRWRIARWCGASPRRSSGQTLVVRAARARIEATRLGLGIPFAAISLTGASPRVLYESLYCACG